MAIRDWPETERPREKLLHSGAAALSDAELLAILLRNGRRGTSALDVARDLIQGFGSLRGLLTADQKELCAKPGMGPVRYALLQAALELAKRVFQELLKAGPVLDTKDALHEYVRLRLRDLKHEQFCCLWLDSQHRLLAFDELFRGTLDRASVHPREVVKVALARNARSVILAHNHPSGVAEPSPCDQQVTQWLKQALALIDVDLLDHLVVGDGRCVSMAQRGMV